MSTAGEFVMLDDTTLRTAEGVPVKAGDLEPGRIYRFDPVTLRLIESIGKSAHLPRSPKGRARPKKPARK